MSNPQPHAGPAARPEQSKPQQQQQDRQRQQQGGPPQRRQQQQSDFHQRPASPQHVVDEKGAPLKGVVDPDVSNPNDDDL